MAWISDSEGKELPEYNVKVVGDDQLECWVPSTEGVNFKIMWKIPHFNNQLPAELGVYPFLDGVSMGGVIWDTAKLMHGLVGELGAHRTSPSTARLYQFGKRLLTDRDDAFELSNAQLNSLNTVIAKFVWGIRGGLRPLEFRNPKEILSINEKSVKNGHSGSAGLGKTVAKPELGYAYDFHSIVGLEPVTFIFRYAPRDWLQARDIIPYHPQPASGPPTRVKREQSFSPDVIDIDDLHTDDEGAMARKSPIPKPITSRKKQCVAKREDTGVKTEVDE